MAYSLSRSFPFFGWSVGRSGMHVSGLKLNIASAIGISSVEPMCVTWSFGRYARIFIK